MFGDLKTPAGVKALDSFLADHSYIEGWVAFLLVAQEELDGFTIKFFIYRYGLLSNVSGMCQARRTHRCMKLLELHLRTLMPFAGESSCILIM